MESGVLGSVKMKSIHQFHPVVTYGDAISNHIISLQRILRAHGWASDIFSEYPQPSFEAPVQRFYRYRRSASAQNVMLLHYSIGYSPEVLGWVRRLPDHKVLIYHNITPADYFLGVNEHYREAAWAGREQLQMLREGVDAAWGDSEFNRQELEAVGFRNTRVLPIIFDPTFYSVAADAQTLARLRGEGGARLLFVGRVVPNKRLQDVILTFYYFKRYVDPQAHLHLVGSHRQMEPYLAYLQALIARLNLPDVHFEGHVSAAELVAFYQGADVFLCMSEHEGFGVPLIESMHYGLPVVAYAAAAVPETMGEAGILIQNKDFVSIAELLGLLLADAAWRERLVRRQREWIRRFYPETVAATLANYLKELA